VLDLTARPFDLRNYGRIVITGVCGTDLNYDGTIENHNLWQRVDGGYVVTPQAGCNRTVTLATLPNNRTLLLDEILFPVQVTYRYRPIFSDIPFRTLSMPIDLPPCQCSKPAAKISTHPHRIANYHPRIIV
jgi:hypothetical protein